MEILKIFLIGVTATVLFMFGLQLFVRWKAGRMVGKELKGFGKEVILYFYSPNCGACKRMDPVIETLSRKARVKRVNVGEKEGLEIARELGVMGTPTTVVVKDGRIKKVFVGFQSEDKILKEVKG